MTSSSPAPENSWLADFDRRRLTELLVTNSGATRATCERTAAKALRLAFSSADHPPWDDATLAEADVGRWARPTLLPLDPRLRLKLHRREPSTDGTVRLLLESNDGALVEAVLIPARAGRKSARMTLCLSTQVGCARACTFCETGRTGLARQLSAGEIVDQVRIAEALCRSDLPRDRRAPAFDVELESKARATSMSRRAISNIVFMGMGEPLDNLREVVRALDLLTDPVAFAYAPSRITVSTVGVVDKIAAFFEQSRVDLAISLHSTVDEQRSAIMPINRKHGLDELRDALLTAVPRNRRIMFQYTLFDGFNDSLADADRLAEFVEPFRCRVNLIPANPGPDPTLVAPPRERFDAFVSRLASRGVTTLVRRPRGRDVGGACGQLAGARRLELLRETTP